MIDSFLEAEANIDFSTIERRMAVDVGSGSTKVTIADVDATENKIISVVLESSFPVPYQASLEVTGSHFDETIQNHGLKVFHHIHEIAVEYHVDKISAIATEAFRKASNGSSFAEKVQTETHIPLKVVSQQEEGIMAFFSGLAASKQDSDKLVVWDIGTGSFQITALDTSDDLSLYMGSMGSIPFRNYIIDLIQGKSSEEITSPNPMTTEDIKNADRFARFLGRKADNNIKRKLKDDEITLVGIGRLFSNSIGPLSVDQQIIRKDLREYIRGSTGRSDDEQNNPFAHVDVSNAILVLAFMKALHIHKVNIVDTKSTRGMLFYKPYWEQSSQT